MLDGTAKLYKNKEIKYNNRGYRFRYRLSQGDAPETFSYALTDVMTYMVENNEIMQRYNRQ